MSASGGVSEEDIYRMLLDSLHWTPSQLLEFQRSQLAQLLLHAKTNVPFYRTRLDCMFRSDGTIDWERWTDIPILTRSDLRDNGKLLLAKRWPDGHGKVASFESSGSTGVPIKVTTTTLANMVLNALWARFYSLNGVNRVHTHVKFWFTKPGNRKFNERFVRAGKNEPNIIYGNRNLPVQQQLDVLQDTKADCLSEFATTLIHMAHENLTRRNPVTLKLVMPYGMALSAADRVVLAQSFKAQVLSPYSSKEAGLLGFHMPSETGYFICADAVVPEFLPAESDRGDGLQRLIITPLFNAAQPLIRYDQGDLVAVAHALRNGCPLPFVTHVAGRSDDYFLLKGKIVPIVGIQDDIVNKLLKAKAFQLAQTGPNAVELRYVATRALQPARKAALTRHLRTKLKQDFSVAYVKCLAIAANAGGKQQRFRREWTP
jgi:phenylacetate-CoA ligase